MFIFMSNITYKKQLSNSSLSGIDSSLVGIFGPGRNGSTLLVRLLDGSPDLWVHPVEVNYFSLWKSNSIMGKIKKLVTTTLVLAKCRYGVPVKASSSKLFGWAREQIESLNNEYLLQLDKPYELRTNPLVSLSNEKIYNVSEYLQLFLKIVKDTYDQRQIENRTIVFKSTEAALAGLYEAFFPELRFIHIIRHPITNYASLKRTACTQKDLPFWKIGQGSNGDILKVFLEWRWIPHTKFALAKASSQPKKHIIVFYEDLAKSPEKVIHRICEWIGVRMPTNPSSLTVLGGHIPKKLPNNPSKKGVSTPNEVIVDMEKKFNYEDVLTKREKEFMRFRTKSLVQKLGYDDNLWDSNDIKSSIRMAIDWIPTDKWEQACRGYGWKYIFALLARRIYIFLKLFCIS